jgi:PPM family protein phosphatase
MQTRSEISGNASPAAPPLLVDVGAVSDRGRVRDNNEDAYVVARAGRYLERLLSNLPDSLVAPRFEASGHVMMVADGMGGMAAGEVASHTAVATMIQLMLSAPKWALQLDDPVTRGQEIEQMWERGRGYLAAVHEALRGHAAANPELAGMGTTMVMAYLVKHDLFVLNVGDSRAYLYRAGNAIQITRDQTLAQAYADMGMIAESEIKSHRLSHVLTQAVGGPEDEIQADLHSLRVIHGDRVVLCSDGLTTVLEEHEIAEILGSATDSQGAAQALVDRVLARGAPDNVTVVVASLASPELERPSR